MRKFARKALTAGAVAATAMALTALPASATPATWTVTPGGAITGTGVSLHALDLTTGAVMNCSTSSASGTAQSGSGLSGTGIATLSSVSFGATPFSHDDNGDGTNENHIGCPATGGIIVEITATGLPWTFNASSYDGSDVTTGTLTGVGATIHGSDFCDAVITGPGGTPGTISGSYSNSAGELSVSGNNLEVHSVDADCDPGLIQQGDTIMLAGSYEVGPWLTITSP